MDDDDGGGEMTYAIHSPVSKSATGATHTTPATRTLFMSVWDGWLGPASVVNGLPLRSMLCACVSNNNDATLNTPAIHQRRNLIYDALLSPAQTKELFALSMAN